MSRRHGSFAARQTSACELQSAVRNGRDTIQRLSMSLGRTEWGGDEIPPPPDRGSPAPASEPVDLESAALMFRVFRLLLRAPICRLRLGRPNRAMSAPWPPSRCPDTISSGGNPMYWFVRVLLPSATVAAYSGCRWSVSSSRAGRGSGVGGARGSTRGADFRCVVVEFATCSGTPGGRASAEPVCVHRRDFPLWCRAVQGHQLWWRCSAGHDYRVVQAIDEARTANLCGFQEWTTGLTFRCFYHARAFRRWSMGA